MLNPGAIADTSATTPGSQLAMVIATAHSRASRWEQRDVSLGTPAQPDNTEEGSFSPTQPQLAMPSGSPVTPRT